MFHKYKYFRIKKSYEYKYSRIEKLYKYRYFRIKKFYRYKYLAILIVNKAYNAKKVFENILQ